MISMFVIVMFLGIVTGGQLFRSLRIVLTQRIPRFQSYDDITKSFSERYREGAERLTSGRYIGRYEGSTQGKQARTFGLRILPLSIIGVIGWFMFVLDVTTPILGTAEELGTLGAIGMILIFGSMGIISVFDYIDYRNYKMRRLH